MSVRKIGDWKRVEHLIMNIRKEMVDAKNISLKRWALKAEGLAKMHISKQDLGWKPLKPATIAAKIRAGFSENILVRSSSYFQSITSWADQMTAYAGVKKEVTNKDGTKIENIAAVHEFGSKSGVIPARPLWTPVMKEVMAWHYEKNSPVAIFALRIKKYGV